MRIVVEKSRRVLTLLREGHSPMTFPVGLGNPAIGHKQLEGDGRTPEGEYRVCTKNARSKYHLSMGLSYPGVRDAEAALADGRITEADRARIIRAHETGVRPPWDTALGGYIMLHGGGAHDWTQGCIALDDRDMDVLFALCPLGTPVTILA